MASEKTKDYLTFVICHSRIQFRSATPLPGFAPEERDVYSLNAFPIAARSGGAQCFGWFANSPYVSLLTERGLIRAAGAINISLRWSEGTFSKLHLKLESTYKHSAATRLRSFTQQKT